MSDSHLAGVLRERERAFTAFVNGAVTELDAISTHQEPVTIFGPKGNCGQGAEAVNAADSSAARSFAPGGANRLETMHQGASGDLAYWKGGRWHAGDANV
ncbi:hypothetical protein E7V67_015440 [[Empedobacter] haloabium]|uniref:Uncharacterized protein n=1 Tax=[Empedobacter] haloabium TaxID=592317 RepID=A0ABZ1UEB1_9BURK